MEDKLFLTTIFQSLCKSKQKSIETAYSHVYVYTSNHGQHQGILDPFPFFSRVEGTKMEFSTNFRQHLFLFPTQELNTSIDGYYNNHNKLKC